MEYTRSKSDLILAISPSQLRHIRNWDKLKSVYASEGPMRKANLLEKLLSLRMQDDADVKDHLSQIMDAVDKLNSIMMFHSLSISFDNFSFAIKSRDKLPDIDSSMIKIIEESESKAHKSDPDTNAMYSKHKFSKNKPPFNNAYSEKSVVKNQL